MSSAGVARVLLPLALAAAAAGCAYRTPPVYVPAALGNVGMRDGDVRVDVLAEGQPAPEDTRDFVQGWTRDVLGAAAHGSRRAKATMDVVVNVEEWWDPRDLCGM